MADIKDVRRLTVSVLILAAVEALLLFFLWLHNRAFFEWAVPEKMLGWMPFDIWALVFAVLFFAIGGVVAMLVFSIPIASASGYAKGRLRQVQCQNCKAVFHMADSGERPLMHPCPSCRSLGFYDGQSEPVGKPPEPELAKKIVQLALKCQSCTKNFKFTDSGVRPLEVSCPECSAVGTIF
jgi:phage FluMu protein Com